MSADYIGECPNCAEHALRVDECICWRTGPNEDDAYASSLAACAAGQSELRYLVADYQAKCHNCDYQQEIVKVLDSRLMAHHVEDPALRCSHCHTRWGEGATKEGFGHLTVCSRCHYSQ